MVLQFEQNSKAAAQIYSTIHLSNIDWSKY